MDDTNEDKKAEASQALFDGQAQTGSQKQSNSLLIAGSIIIAGFFIALAIIHTSGKNAPLTSAIVSANNNSSEKTLAVKSISKDDRILGNFDALVKIIEFSDTECPYCKMFHATMKKIMDEYGPRGQVAWVYRHYPLEIHPKAQKEAEAAECASEQGFSGEGGNLIFWKYIDRVFEVTPSNNGLDPAELTNIAKYLNLHIDEFNVCLNSGKYAERVASQKQDGENAGAKGTPHSIIIIGNKEALPLEGAMPYSDLKKIIESALKI